MEQNIKELTTKKQWFTKESKPGTETLKLSCLLRIADAAEKAADSLKAYAEENEKLRARLEHSEETAKTLTKLIRGKNVEINRLTKSVTAYKGHITRLKQQN